MKNTHVIAGHGFSQKMEMCVGSIIFKSIYENIIDAD